MSRYRHFGLHLMSVAGVSSSALGQLVGTGDAREVFVSAQGALGQTVVMNEHTYHPIQPYAPWYISEGEFVQIQYLNGGTTATQGSVIQEDYMAGTLRSDSHAYGGLPGGVAGGSHSQFWARFRVFQFPVQVRLVGYVNGMYGAAASCELSPASPAMNYLSTNGRLTFNELRTLVPGEYVMRATVSSISDSTSGPPPCHSDAQFFLTTHTNDCMYILGQPATAASYPGGSVVFHYPAIGVPTVVFHWRRNGMPLLDGPTGTGSVISGADTEYLEITNLSAADAGTYDCTAVNPCTSNVSSAATLTVCYADCDGSTTPPILNVSDFSCFLNAFAAGDSYANCDGSTTPPVLNVADFACFLNVFATGCS